MEWLCKGIRFDIETQTLGPFCLASARARQIGPFVRIKPFSALGKSEREALTLLKRQIELEYEKTPEL
jgi:hypothetical protein